MRQRHLAVGAGGARGFVDAQRAVDDGKFGVGAQVDEGHAVIVGSARPGRDS